jgi:trimeric autotransporter adhesin
VTPHVCDASETELEDPKGLRAEIRKFLISTNERKNMSTKTMKQRIALVAVSALTAGLFSVVSAPVANAALDVGDIDFAAVNRNVTASVNTGACLISNTDVVNTSTAVFATGSDVNLVTTGIAAADVVYAAISGPAVWKRATVAAGTTLGATFNSNATTVSWTGAAGTDILVLTLTGTGTVTVSWGASATVAATDTLTITSVAACGNGALDITQSFSMVDDAVANNATTNIDDATSASAGSPLYVKSQLIDGYGQPLTSSSTVLATATNGALVRWGTPGTALIKGTAGSVATANAAQHVMLRVDPASAAAGGTTTVTISVGSTVVTTKNLTFFGETTSIDILATSSGTIGTGGAGTSTGYFVYQYKDAAGRVVPGLAATLVATTATSTITAIGTSQAPRAVAGAVVSDLVDAIDTAIGSTASGIAPFSCGPTSSSSTVTISHTSAVNATVVTKPVTLTCAGGVATYTVSTDKAAYKIGEIAVITITAKDSAGNAVSNVTNMGADGLVSVGGGTLTRASVTADTFTGGVRTYNAQMTTEGTFNTVVAVTGTTTKSATTGYSVSPSVTGTSNADVLKAIVSLIASINKQIAALQKALLKR